MGRRHRSGGVRAALGRPRKHSTLLERWRWAASAAVAGATAGVAAAYVVARLRPQDALDALDPESVVAVVDRPAP